MKSPWKKLGSKIVYQNPYWKVRKDRVVRPDKKEGSYYFVDKRDFVSVVAVDAEGGLYLVRQWRYVINKNVMRWYNGNKG